MTDWPYRCELHIFFARIEETEDMLNRLANECILELEEPSRSKIGKTTQIISPIDAVAARVSSTKK